MKTCIAIATLKNHQVKFNYPTGEVTEIVLFLSNAELGYRRAEDDTFYLNYVSGTAANIPAYMNVVQDIYETFKGLKNGI